MHKIVTILAGVVIILALTIGCAPAPAPPGPTPPGPTPPTVTNVKIGNISHLTGPFTETGVTNAMALWDYTYWWNEEVGKKIGVEIDLITEDCRNDATLISEIWMRYRDEGCVGCFFFCSSESNMLIKECEHAQIPATSTASSWYLYIPASWVFNGNMSLESEMLAFLRWLETPEGKEYEKDKPWVKEGRKPCIGGLGVSSPYGTTIIAPLFEWCKKHSWPWAGYETVPFTFPTAEPQLQRLAARGADYIFMSHSGAPCAVVWRDAYRMKLHERGVTTVSHHGVYDRETMGLAEEAGEHTFGLTPYALPEENTVAWQEMQKAHKERTGKELEFVDAYWLGYGDALIMYEAIRMLVEDMDMDPAKITGKDIYEVLPEVRAEAKGAYPEPFGWFPGGEYSPCHATRIQKWHYEPGKGKIEGHSELITDWLVDPPGLWYATKERRAELVAYEEEGVKGPWKP